MQDLPQPIPSTKLSTVRNASNTNQFRRVSNVVQFARATCNMSEQSDEKYMWGHEATCDLIQLYKKHPVLYSSCNSDYKNKGKRLQALNTIRVEMVKRGRRTSVEDIKRKIHGLRTQYAHQLSKMKKNEELKPTLWCYNQLDFLRNSYEGQADFDNENLHESKDLGQFSVYEHNDDSQEVASFYDEGNVVKQEVAHTSSVAETPVFMTADGYNKEKNDDLTTFGKLVELELRKITSSQALRKAKREIINILMDAQEVCDN